MISEEIIDILDDDGKVIGSMSREDAENDNHITENVLVFVFNSEGRVWTQLRSKSKKHFPSMWDISACGGIETGESRDVAAERETREETGLILKLHHVESFLNVFPGADGRDMKRMSHLYVGRSDGTPEINDEVEEFRLWDINELTDSIEASPSDYVPSFLPELKMAIAGYGQHTKRGIL